MRPIPFGLVGYCYCLQFCLAECGCLRNKQCVSVHYTLCPAFGHEQLGMRHTNEQ